MGVLRSAALAATLLLALPGCLSDLHRHTPGHVDLPNACGTGARRTTYAVYLPPGHRDPARVDERWPLLLYLPGTLTFGHDVRRLGDGDPPGVIECGRDLPMVVLTAMTPKLWERWHPSVVMALVDHAIRRYRVDPDRVYLSGVPVMNFHLMTAVQTNLERFTGLTLLAIGAVLALLFRRVSGVLLPLAIVQLDRKSVV